MAVAVKNTYSCGNSCILGSPYGMGTNGGCHCLDTIRKTDFDKYRRVSLGIQELKSKIAELEDTVTGLYEDLAGEDL